MGRRKFKQSIVLPGGGTNVLLKIMKNGFTCYQP